MTGSSRRAGTDMLRSVRLFVVAALFSAAALGQGSLALSSATTANGAAALNLTLSSPIGNEPAAIQWTVAYPAATVASIDAAAAGTAATAGKFISCNSRLGLYTCVLCGMNASVIQNGTVAVVNVTLAPGVTAASIDVTNTLGATADGNSMTMSGAGGILTAMLPSITAVSCSPASLMSGGVSTCTATLSQLGGGIVALSSNVAALTVPASVTVPATATSATFTAAAGTVAADQTATVTASLNGSTRATSIALAAPPVITAVSCNPGTLSSGQTSTCTVILSKAGGGVVALSSSLAALTVPASVTVASTATTATFSVTATTVSVDQTAALTASLNGSTQSAAIALAAPAVVTGISCTPATLASGQTAQCSVALSRTGGATVSLTSSAAALTVPASVTVAPAATSATFTATAATIASDQNATVTATLNGGAQTATIALLAPAAVTGLACSPAALGAGQASVCTVTLSHTGSATVAITSTVTTLSAPGSVSIASSASSATFPVTAAATVTGQNATITASLNGTSKSTSVALVTAAVLTGVTCSPAVLRTGQTSTCTVTVSKSGGATVDVTSSAAELIVPRSVVVSTMATTATFMATAGIVAADRTATITAAFNGGTQTSSLILFAPAVLSGLSCSPAVLNSGQTSACTVTMSSTDGGVVGLTSTAPSLSVPASVTVPASATTATFTASAGTIASDQAATVTASLNGSRQLASLVLAASVAVSGLSCDPVTLASGQTAICTVTVSKAGGGAVTLTSSGGGLSVPPSVEIRPSATTATFTVAAGSFTADHAATITASLNGSAQTASIALGTATAVTSLTCSPVTVTAGQVTTCVVTVSKTGGATVVLVSDKSSLAVPPTVTIGPNSTSATFAVGAGAISSDQTATITASLNGLKTATLALAPLAITLTGLSCEPAKLLPGQTATCLVMLSRSGGAAVVLASNSGALTVPDVVTIPPTASAATFTATAGSVGVEQTATIAATLNGATRTAAIALSPATAVSGLSCIPVTISSGQTATCTVTLSDSGGGALAITSNAPLLSVPASANVAPGTSSATFTVTARTVFLDQSATISAALNGSSKAVSIALTVGVAVTGLSCNPAILSSGQTATCMLTLSKSGGGAVSITTTATALTSPGTVTVAPSATTASFTIGAGTVVNEQTATVTASLGGGSQSESVTLRPAAQTGISLLACNPDSSAVGTLKCRIELAQAAPLGGVSIALQADSVRLGLPQQIQVSGGSQSAEFTVSVLASDVDEQPLISASMEGMVRTASVPITGIRPIGVTCASASLEAGSRLDCEVRMNSSNIPEVARLKISTNNPQLRIPASITTRPGRVRIPFQLSADPDAKQHNSQVTIQFGQTTVMYAVAVAAAKAPLLSLPEDVDAVTGQEIAFTFSATDPDGLPLSLAANLLPAGAIFDVATGRFTWIPDRAQEGRYEISFTATNSVGRSATAALHIEVDSGKPIITAVRNAATSGKLVCSSGSLATVDGRWLSAEEEALADPSGSSVSLGGSRVRVNGQDVPLVYVSRRRIDFVCPAAEPGTPLRILVETAAAISEAAQTTARAVAPGLFSLDGSGTGQGVIHLAGSSLLAAPRDYTAAGQPAEPGDVITIRATGVGPTDGFTPTVLIGGSPAHVRSIERMPGAAGVVEITVEVPLSAQEGTSVPMFLIVQTANGAEPGASARRSIYRVRSNQITFAIEPARP